MVSDWTGTLLEWDAELERLKVSIRRRPHDAYFAPSSRLSGAGSSL